jgi:hypothetical protein
VRNLRATGTALLFVLSVNVVIAASTTGGAMCDRGPCLSGVDSFTIRTTSFRIPTKLIASAADLIFGGSIPAGASLAIPDVKVTLADTLVGEPWVNCTSNCCDPERSLTMVVYVDFHGEAAGGLFSNSGPVRTTARIEVDRTEDGSATDLDARTCRTLSSFHVKTGSASFSLAFAGVVDIPLVGSGSLSSQGYVEPRIASSCSGNSGFNQPPILVVPAGITQGVADDWFTVPIEVSDLDPEDVLRVIVAGPKGCQAHYVASPGGQCIRILLPEQEFDAGELLTFIVEAYDVMEGLNPSDAELTDTFGQGYAHHYVRESFQVETRTTPAMRLPNIELSYPQSVVPQEYEFYVESPGAMVESTNLSSDAPDFIKADPAPPEMGTDPCCSQLVRVWIYPREAPVGTHTITYRTRNVAGLLADGTITLHILPPVPPTAFDDSFGKEDRDPRCRPGECCIICPVLENDTDPDGDSLRAELISSPRFGAVESRPSGDGFVYVPFPLAHNYVDEPDTFTYRACDETGCSAPATVAVRACVAPVPWTAQAWIHPEPTSSKIWATATSTLGALDIDYGGTPSLYEFSLTGSPYGGPSGLALPSPMHSLPTISILGLSGGDRRTGTAAIGNAVTKEVTIQLDGAFSRLGTYFFQYTATDPDGLSGIGGLTVHVYNNAPICLPGRQVRLTYDSLHPPIYALDPAWYEAGCLSFGDPDGDPLSFHLGQFPEKGQVDLLPSGSRGQYGVTVLYTVDRKEAQATHRGVEPYVDRFSVVAEDPFGGTAETEVEVAVDVLNSPPICLPDSATTPCETPVEIAVLANDSDPDQDQLTTVAIGASTHGTCRLDGGLVTYTPDALFYGCDAFSYSVIDGHGGTTTAEVTVTVVDTDPPLFTWEPPSEEPLDNDPDLCGAAVTWTPPVTGVDVTDNIGIADITSTHVPGGVFPVGSTVVTYTATDPSGNAATKTFAITVEDRQAPALFDVPSDIVTAVGEGETTKAVFWAEPTATDNCAVASLVSSIESGAAFPLGTTSVTITATDIHANAITKPFTVTVNGPLKITADDVEMITERDDGDSVSFGASTAGGCPPISIECNPPSGSFFPIGTTAVTITAMDACGTAVTGTLEVTVIQQINEPPIANDDHPPAMTSPWIEVKVLANDIDPDGDRLTLVSFGTPPCGEVTRSGADSNAIYFAAAGCDAYRGETISFTYRIEDEHGATSQGRVYLQIPDDINLPRCPQGG